MSLPQPGLAAGVSLQRPPVIPPPTTAPRAAGATAFAQLMAKAAPAGAASCSLAAAPTPGVASPLLTAAPMAPVAAPAMTQSPIGMPALTRAAGAQAYGGAPSRTPISDEQFYNADAMSAAEIDAVLAQKGSPFAGRTFRDGKTLGQLMAEKCQNAGTEGERRTLNPAVLLSIMGAETSFGRDGAWRERNPFSIRWKGSFDNVADVEESMRIAANTMVNWANARPSESRESRFDFAGRNYCENYDQTWKPNVESLYSEFSQAFGRSRGIMAKNA